MLSQHGWKTRPSPRRGFTVVEASRGEESSPVVLAVHDSAQALHLFRVALDEAMTRRCNLIVLDYGVTSLQDGLDDESNRQIEPRERMALRMLRVNPHVTVIRTQPSEADLEDTVAFCEKTNPALLILAADHIGGPRMTSKLARRLFNGEFDVMVVAEPSRQRSGFGHP